MERGSRGGDVAAIIGYAMECSRLPWIYNYMDIGYGQQLMSLAEIFNQFKDKRGVKMDGMKCQEIIYPT